MCIRDREKYRLVDCNIVPAWSEESTLDSVSFGCYQLMARYPVSYTHLSTEQQMVMAEVCYPKSVQELYVFLKSTYLRRAIRFKRCQLCGRLFAATDGDRTEYCSREYEKEMCIRDR